MEFRNNIDFFKKIRKCLHTYLKKYEIYEFRVTESMRWLHTCSLFLLMLILHTKRKFLCIFEKIQNLCNPSYRNDRHVAYLLAVPTGTYSREPKTPGCDHRPYCVQKDRKT